VRGIKSEEDTMTTLIIAAIAILAAIPAGIALWFLISLAWMAKGDDSLNGVKDRDAGAP
jgi:hypothetical protein